VEMGATKGPEEEKMVGPSWIGGLGWRWN